MELDRARRLFLEVSSDYPNSLIAQAAGIAYTCLRENDVPEGMLLLCQPAILEDLVKIAHHAHRHISDVRQPVNIDVDRVERIIRIETSIAHQLLEAGLRRDQLQDIISLSENAKSEGMPGPVRERVLAELIEIDYGIDLNNED